jgi:ribonuclease VapC
MTILLDASAVLAYLQEEPGAETVAEALAMPDECQMSAANHAEVISRCLDRGVTEEIVDVMLAELGYQVIPVQAEDGALAGRLRRSTRASGLSLGDLLCLATAMRLACPVMTTDRPWLNVAGTLGLDIRCIRPGSH